jgi:hypothetical protein
MQLSFQQRLPEARAADSVKERMERGSDVCFMKMCGRDEWSFLCEGRLKRHGKEKRQ